MGLFDYVKINYDLPTPNTATEKHVEFIKNAIDTEEFQTKDLDCVLNKFCLDKDGYLYEQNEGKYEKRYVHQHVFCYTSIKMLFEDISYWLEYNIKFTDGKVKDVTIEQWYPIIKKKIN